MADPTDTDLADSLSTARQQFAQQIAFFRSKLNLPTERWDDIQRAAHDRAFIVAGAQKADLLADLRRAVDESVRGGNIGDFRNSFAEAVSRSGWTGWAGEDSPAGQAWRTRTIYRTNMSSSYAAGRWQQLNDPALRQARPYWCYVHADGELHPRPQHLAWNGLTLPAGDPFWETHMPPNGWGCQCRVVPVRAPAPGAPTQRPEGWDTPDPKTGAPLGIDKGWDYAPGAQADAGLRQMVQDKLVDYPPAIERALSADIKRHLNATEAAPDFVQRAVTDRQHVEDLWLGFVDRPDAISVLTGVDVKGFTALLPAQTARHVADSHGHDGGDQRPPTPQDYAQVLDVLNDPDGLRLGSDTGNNGEPRIVARKTIDNETLESVWEVRPGKRNRALALHSLWIKTGGKKSEG